jgi:hypothetical protein
MTQLSSPFQDILISPVESGPFFIGQLFERKFGQPAPDYGNPVVCFYRKNWDHFIPLCYTSFLPYREVILVGGAMTNGRVFAQMDGALADEIRQSGGIYYHVLKFAFDHFKDDCEAYFGHAGDRRAYEVDIRAGFEPTRHRHLIVHFHKPISSQRKEYLIEEIHGIGPF